MNKMMVLGLDGACWPLLEPWLAAGLLPNLEALRQEAVWGPLQSQLPPVTSPNWRCYATGRNPGRLGVYWWEIIDKAQQIIRHPTSQDFHTAPLWHNLADAGYQTAVINFPTGYPPRAIKNGWFTAGGPGAKDSGYAQPGDWENELRERYGYRVHPTAVLQSDQDVALHLEEILAMMQARFDVAFDMLASGVDFLHLTLFYINVLQHFCYQGAPTQAAWQMIDHNLGRLREIANTAGYHILLMSDHGCAPVDTVFYINTWLEQEGYLVMRQKGGQQLGQIGINRQKLISIARRTGLAPLLRKIVPGRVQRALPNADGTLDKEAKGERIDWERSKAVASGQGPIYLLVSDNDPGYAPLRAEISGKLAALRNPVSGEPVAVQVLPREEAYAGPYLAKGPDLIFEQGPGIHTSGGIGHRKIFAAPQKWAAENIRDGLFLAWGPDFSAGGNMSSVRIIDLAPTILHLLNSAVPEDVDGRVLQELFRPESEPASRDIRYSHPEGDAADRPYSADEESAIADQLSALGYLD